MTSIEETKVHFQKRSTSLKIIRKEHLQNNVCVVVGTRPGIIKMSPIIRELERKEVAYFVLHTGQHYSYEMDKKFFEDLGLPEPQHKLRKCNEGSLHGEQTAYMLMGIETVLVEERPRLVLVCGDANTNLAGALAARKLQIEVGHVESGLRSNDWRMPEEHNRVMIDHISEYLFAPTRRAKQNLIQDNVTGKIYLTGNTIVDALEQHLEIAKKKANILETLNIPREGYYILITIHREENVDYIDGLKGIVKAIALVGKESDLPMVFPIHPRTRRRLETFNLINQLSSISNLHIINPVGYLDFLLLLSKACMVLTDSGGIQEESCILKVPCVTLRDSTERQETVEVGSNIVCGTEPEDILRSVRESLRSDRDWPNPFGDGKAAERIVDVLLARGISEWGFSFKS